MKKHTKRLVPMGQQAHDALERAAAIAKCLANPKRFGIIEALATSERTVGDLARHLGIASQVVSVELRIMKEFGAVASRREHPEVFYRLADERLIEAARLIRQAAESRARAGIDVPIALSRKRDDH
jgi:ArsR family transcriptional regulator